MQFQLKLHSLSRRRPFTPRQQQFTTVVVLKDRSLLYFVKKSWRKTGPVSHETNEERHQSFPHKLLSVSFPPSFQDRPDFTMILILRLESLMEKSE
jgi:hypothetical protein